MPKSNITPDAKGRAVWGPWTPPDAKLPTTPGDSRTAKGVTLPKMPKGVRNRDELVKPILAKSGFKGTKRVTPSNSI